MIGAPQVLKMSCVHVGARYKISASDVEEVFLYSRGIEVFSQDIVLEKHSQKTLHTT